MAISASSIGNMTAPELRDALMRVHDRVKRARDEYKMDLQELANRGLVQIACIATGAIVGLARAAWGDKTTGDVEIPGIKVDVDLAAGVLLTAPALFGMFGNASDVVNAVGATLNGIVVARESERLLKPQFAK